MKEPGHRPLVVAIMLIVTAGLITIPGLGYPRGDAGKSTDFTPATAAATDPKPKQDTGPNKQLVTKTSISPDVIVLQTATRRIRDFLAGALDLGIDPASLFDVSLDDEDMIRVEAERLRGVIEMSDQPRAEQPTPPSKKVRLSRRGTKRQPSEQPPNTGVTDSGIEKSLQKLNPVLFTARLELDRARLGFYLLPKIRREAIFRQHAERQRIDSETRATSGFSQSERKAREAEKERERALKAAQHARSEAERLVAEERARLLEVSRVQANFETELARARQALKQRAERALSFRRRVRDLVEGRFDTMTADTLYDELRIFLHSSRNELASAISANFSASRVPETGSDRLGDLSVDVDRSAVDQERQEVQATALRLRTSEQELNVERASQLYDEVRSLNSDRLTLLYRLSYSKRSAITGFTSTGIDQAAAELKQVTLVLKYHFMATLWWITAISNSSSKRGKSAVTAGLVTVKMFFAVIIFLWWRRRSGPLLEQWRDRLQEEDRRTRATNPSRWYRFLGFIQQTRRPFEWLVFVGLLVWLLPSEAKHQMEISLLSTLFTWTLGGSLAVSTINSLAGSEELQRVMRNSTQTAELRLRSLRLIGRTVVVFGLILALGAQLVGRGTIYSWVFSVCWFAAIPVVIVIVRWWRNIIFERIDAIRRKKAFEQWIVANRSGWKSFPLALIAGAYLFAHGSIRAIRTWMGRFDITRRVLAYLFRRGLDRLAEEKAKFTIQPLSGSTYAALGPETASTETVPGSADDQVKSVVERIKRIGGGVFAVVGERGGGKTTVLRRVRDTCQDVVFVDCPETGLEGLRSALAAGLNVDPSASLENCASALNANVHDSGLLIDNAHRLIQPVMGGLASFDRLIDVARTYSSKCTWFLSVNEVIWRFFERARGARPLFDEVVTLDAWREEEIVNLLTARCRQVGIQPSFEHFLERLPPDADEFDRAEALERAAAGYYRLLWDYSAGNPGVALHMWRRSLGMDTNGKVYVKLFQAPDVRELEQLPDPAIFVLRAVIQLEPARLEDVARATMLRTPQVEDALRYGLARGYFKRDGDRYRVTWGWFRPITRFLQRHHLLATRR